MVSLASGVIIWYDLENFLIRMGFSEREHGLRIGEWEQGKGEGRDCPTKS